jgi:MoaA/NifB/PqqE/SkfB family radical SAM enzyme
MNEIADREKVKSDVELQSDELLDIIFQLPSGSNITFTGGEVFIKKEIEKILEKSSAKHNICIASNGLLLKKHSELIINNRIKSIGISLDGPPETHEHIRNHKGLFEKLQDGLRLIVEHKLSTGSSYPTININAVILRENYRTLQKIVPLVKTLGANSLSLQVFDPSLSRSGLSLQESINLDENPLNRIEKIDPESLQQSLEQVLQAGLKHKVDIHFMPELAIDEIVRFYQGQFDFDKWHCFLPWHTMRISPYGDIYPCLNLFIGNVRDGKLGRFLNNERYVEFRRMLKDKTLFNACIGCCKMARK